MVQGRELGVQLADLWKAGQVQLPQVAQEFTNAYVALPLFISGSLYRSGGLGAGDGSSGAAGSWEALAGKLGDILSQTADNLRDTGVALVYAANNYAATDAEAQAEFEKRKKQIEVTR